MKHHDPLEVLAFISAFIEREGYAPSTQEIGAAVGISSTSQVAYHLSALERDGYIGQAREKSRARWVTARGEEALASAAGRAAVARLQSRLTAANPKGALS